MRVWVPAGLLSAWLVAALLAPVLPLSPNDVELPKVLSGPMLDAWFGHDELGRPVLDRLISGARTSLLVAVSVVCVSFLR